MSDLVQILVGDVRKTILELETDSVACVWTSPPYWGLRAYTKGPDEIGRERTWPEYIENIVGVFRAVRRVLRSDGSVFLNLGDVYATGAGSARIPGGEHFGKQNEAVDAGAFPFSQANRMPQPRLKPKDLCLLPARVAIALQADGWWVRADIVWDKSNGQPESVRDRVTRSHEYIFHLTKSERYYWDRDAFREPHAASESSAARAGRRIGKNALRGQAELRPRGNLATETRYYNPLGRNRRSVWRTATANYGGSHFAVAPAEIVTPCILGSTRPGDIVLDTFAGTGVTGAVAFDLGRRAVLCELNPEYVPLIRERFGLFAPAVSA